MKKSKKVVLLAPLALSAMLLGGCVKPYDKPEFVEIKPNQTAFVIPLEGKTSEQGKFESEDYLKEAQVATKRIEIPHKWVKTGRFANSGKYVDTIRVIVVDRYPETRQWAGEGAFVGESKDSVKFNQGISVTAQIQEEDSAKYLYRNAGKDLKTVVDNEVHDYIGSVLLEQYSSKTIEEIRGNKSAVLEKVRERVVPYFKDLGITITNLGFVDDMKYLDPAIQAAINKKFNAQEEAKAQESINKKNEAQAESERKQAEQKASTMKTQREIRELEIKEEWVKKWDGKLPVYITGDNASIMNMPDLSGTKE